MTAGADSAESEWAAGASAGSSSEALWATHPSEELPVKAAADPLIGAVVAERYRIVELLGRGGMGIVYKVEHARIGKLLAMKLLTGELSRNPAVVRRFKQEAQTASRLSSPNTVQVFDFGAAEGLTYLVMELVSGEDLGRVLRTTGTMAVPRLCQIIIQVASSLAEAHQKGIVHRDVKPENIMLVKGRDGSDIAKVLDFGLAKLREGAELNDITTQGSIVGTPYFMAPEQILGEAVDPRTDIYALGAVMYRALTGSPPFVGPTPLAVFAKHLNQPVVPPSERVGGVPKGMNDIILRALEKKMTDRFVRIEELKAALVSELRALGLSTGDEMLDSGHVRILATGRSSTTEGTPLEELATRDEVERYERELRRKRYGLSVAVSALALGSLAISAKVLLEGRGEQFRPLEVEPNDSPGEANPMRLGKAISGYLGRRIDAKNGDRDFYAVEIPKQEGLEQSVVALHMTSLPNLPMCALLYRQGLATAVGQYCVGRPGRELSIPALRVSPGSYFLAVRQDLDPYGGSAPFIHENVSDLYTVTLDETKPEPLAEVEPNDAIATATPIDLGARVSGRIGWAGDEDMFCLPNSVTQPIRWLLRDEVRDAGAVLEATPMHGTAEAGPVRVHAGKGPVTSTDVESPWQSDVQRPDPDIPRCLRVRLSIDPWSSGSHPIVPNGGREAYSIEATPVVP